MRINQYLAKCGLGSRRKVEKFIEQGEVQVNGETVSDLSIRIDPDKDQVKHLGKIVSLHTDTADTWIYHKPLQRICTRSDPQGRPTIYDDLPHLPPPYQAAGRLDYESRGLMIISKDGGLIEKLIHPRYEVEKIYEVIARGNFNDSSKKKLAAGVKMEEGGTGKADTLEHKSLSNNQHYLKLLLKRGKKREIRYSLRALNLEVLDLFRIQLANIKIGNLKAGESRELNSEELKGLEKIFL